jgi:hypothetical protein
LAKFAEKKLSSGWEVRLRPVPPLAQSAVLDMSKYVHPPAPMQEVKTGKDKKSVEYVSYGPNHPEMIAWHRECGRLDQRQFEDGTEFSYSYGVHSWREDGGEWLTKPPKDWEIDPAFVSMLQDDDEFHRRLAFIKTELILSPDDLAEVQRTLYSVQPVKGADLDVVEQLFRDPIQVRAIVELLNRQLEDDGELVVSRTDDSA